LKPPGWGFPKDKVKDIPNPFLELPERVMERIPQRDCRFPEEKKKRTFNIESTQVPSSDDPKRLWKGYQDKKPLGRRSPDAMSMDHPNSEMRKLKG
jgi:hypothetical protein